MGISHEIWYYVLLGVLYIPREIWTIIFLILKFQIFSSSIGCTYRVMSLFLWIQIFLQIILDQYALKCIWRLAEFLEQMQICLFKILKQMSIYWNFSKPACQLFNIFSPYAKGWYFLLWIVWPTNWTKQV
jgi:hypothetical protein